MSTFVQDFYIRCVLSGVCHKPNVIWNFAILCIKPTHTPELGFSVSKFFVVEEDRATVFRQLGAWRKRFGLPTEGCLSNVSWAAVPLSKAPHPHCSPLLWLNAAVV